MKKFIFIALLLAPVLLFASPVTGKPHEVYTDIKGSFAGEAILELTGQGILKGVSPGLFEPDQYMSRGHFCVLLAKSLGVLPFYPAVPSFVDLPPNDPAFGYIEALVKLGIVSGNSSGGFGPNLPLSRQDAAVMVYRALNENLMGEVKYRDMDSVSPYAAQAVTSLTLKGWLSGSNGFFYPLKELTRAQAAVLSSRLFDWRKRLARNYLRDVTARQANIETGGQLSLEPVRPFMGLNFTTVYGTDNPGLGVITPEGVYKAGRNPGSALITVNAGNNCYNVRLTAAKNTGEEALPGAYPGQVKEIDLDFTYSVQELSPDSAYRNMEYKQYSGPVDGLSSGTEPWTGFLRQQGRDITADLGRVMSVSSISLEFKQDINAGIAMPEYMQCQVSADGEKWYHLGRVNHSVLPWDKEVQTRTICLSFPPVNVKYIKLSFPVDVYVFARHLSIKGGINAENPGVLPHVEKKGPAEPDYLSVTGMRDIMLVFSGANGDLGTWAVSDFMPLVGYMDQSGNVKDRMFDSILFLPFPGTTGNLNSWRLYLDNLFAPGVQLEALDAAVAVINDKLGNQVKEKVVLTIPYPDPAQRQFGALDDGKQLSFSEDEVGREQALQNRTRAVQWYYDELMHRWNEAGFNNLELAGIYWYKENMDRRIPGERELVQSAARIVRNDGYRFLWIPYFGANGYQDWRSYGFSNVILQPNFYSTDNPPEDRMDNVAAEAGKYGMGIELELDDRVTYSRYYYDLFYRQLNKGRLIGLDGEVTNAYYAGSKTILKARASGIPRVRAIYDDLYRWIKGTYSPADVQ